MRGIFRRRTERFDARAVGLAVFASLAGWAAFAALTPQLDAANGDPPGGAFAVTAGVALLVFCSLLWVWLSKEILHRRVSSKLLFVWLAAAVAARGLLIFSPPALEIDYFRYFWDGEVGARRINPYRFSPEAVIEADRAVEPPTDPALRRLLATLEDEPSLRELLYRVHYPQIPTAYPPMSQRMFALAAALDRPFDPVRRLRMWKLSMVALEAGALGLTAWLLHLSCKPASWAAIPATCPLAIKEVADSGRIDCLAALLVVSAVTTLVAFRRRPSLGATIAGALLGLAFAAKLYPLVLTPLVVGWMWGISRTRSTGATTVFAGGLGFGVATFVAYWPYCEFGRDWRMPWHGAAIFAEHWRMNDLLFGFVDDNLTAARSNDAQPWYALFPTNWRLPADSRIARILTAGVAMAIAVRNAWRIVRLPEPAELGSAALATLGWFWLWCPTGNPWYLLWLLPFLPFAHNPAWRWLPAVALLYYGRFACESIGSPAVRWFDEIGVWIEFGPWLGYWAWWEFRHRRALGRRNPDPCE
jgi:hypothetical protein